MNEIRSSFHWKIKESVPPFLFFKRSELKVMRSLQILVCQQTLKVMSTEGLGMVRHSAKFLTLVLSQQEGGISYSTASDMHEIETLPLNRRHLSFS